MKTLKGIAISPGYAEGDAFLFKQQSLHISSSRIISKKDIPKEIARFETALQTSVHELHILRDRVLAEIGQTEGDIFETHLMLLKDQQFIEGVKKRIHDEIISVEKAIADEVTKLEQLLNAVESEYLRERSKDIRDIGKRLFKHLDTRIPCIQDLLVRLPSNTVLVARELLPSDTIDLDRDHVIAVVTEIGGSQSHAAILARSLGIPSITGVNNITEKVSTGDRLLIDAEKGLVTISPNQKHIVTHKHLQEDYYNLQSKEAQQETSECQTLDGYKCKLYANIGRPEETLHIHQHNMKRIGV